MVGSKEHVTNINKKDLNLVLLFNLFVAFLGSLFLWWNDVTAGKIFSGMFLGGTVLIFLTFFFLKDDNSLKPITNFVKIPFSTNTSVAAFFYLSGMAIPFIIKGILKIAGSAFTITSFSIPLFGAELRDVNFQTFATASLETSMPWKVFTIMFVAGNIETYTYNFVLVIFGALVGYFVYTLLTDSDEFIVSKITFVRIFAFGLSIALFILSHLLNDTYAGIMFLIAGLFLGISNFTIYVVGVFLTFWAGYHQSNNLIWLAETFGTGAVITQGFISWFGLIFFIYIGLLLWYLLRKYQSGELGRELRKWYR